MHLPPPWARFSSPLDTWKANPSPRTAEHLVLPFFLASFASLATQRALAPAIVTPIEAVASVDRPCCSSW
eukprot:scaffold2696_cov333-Pavlova_lutheri.AAC.12